MAKAAYRLARALLAAALPLGLVDAVGADLALLARLVGSEPSVAEFVGNPRIPAADKQRVLGAAARAELVRRLLASLIQTRDTGLLRGISAEYDRQRRRRTGAIRAEIETAVPLTAAEIEHISSALTRRTGRAPSLYVTVRPELLGGIRVRFDGRVVDGSVRARLGAIRERLLTQ